MNLAQPFMAAQIVLCLAGAIGFVIDGQPWAGSVWFFYSLANIGWWAIAGGKS